MKTVTLYGKRLENYEASLSDMAGRFELEPAEERKWPLRALLADIDALHWVDWVNAWEPAPPTGPRNPRTPARSATEFSLQALDTLAAVTVARRSLKAG
jgi:hypothetical protein